MKRSTGSIVVIAISITLALGGCGGQEKSVGSVETQTIAPAKGQPDDTAAGTDAMTQTVDVEKGRSEGEGHGTEAGAATTDSATTVTTATVAPATTT